MFIIHLPLSITINIEDLSRFPHVKRMLFGLLKLILSILDLLLGLSSEMYPNLPILKGKKIVKQLPLEL
jgi:hypothetical protein